MGEESVSRQTLPRTYSAFFERFDGLREVQRRAIPRILAGDDVLISSATASGKTEAFAAPAAEIALAANGAPFTVLILSPTRALANDLKRRLEGPMGLAEVSFGRHTGEHKERVGGRRPAIAVATPEALDSLLARRPEALAAVRLLAIDEVHVLDGTGRGDQLRILLHRLEACADARPQRVAVSATVDDEEGFAARYLAPGAARVTLSGARTIKAKRFDGKELPDMARHLDLLAGAGVKKALVFCRSRNEIEMYAAKLRGETRFGTAVFAHHGSLSKQVRERNERLFLTAGAAVCFATTTLEMGIDIGTVDYVVTVGAPSDVSSLLQRIGRGGRRGSETRAGYVVDCEAEAHVVRTMFREGAAGRLCAGPYGFRPGVLAQQAISACGRHHIELGEVAALVPAELRPEAPRWERELMDAMVQAGALEPAGPGRWVLSEVMHERWERGTVHGNIDSAEGELEVIDRLTGDTVGAVDTLDSRRLALGGASRRVEHLSGNRVLTDATRRDGASYFRPSMGPTVSLPQARAVVEGLGVPEGSIGHCAFDGRKILLHGLGTIGVKLLATLLAPCAPTDPTPYTLTVARIPDRLPDLPPDFVERLLKDEPGPLERRTGPGPWARFVPSEWRRESVQACHDLNALVRRIGDLSMVELASADVRIVRDL